MIHMTSTDARKFLFPRHLGGAIWVSVPKIRDVFVIDGVPHVAEQSVEGSVIFYDLVEACGIIPGVRSYSHVDNRPKPKKKRGRLTN